VAYCPIDYIGKYGKKIVETREFPGVITWWILKLVVLIWINQFLILHIKHISLILGSYSGNNIPAMTLKLFVATK
jgi:hypothetical protein